MKGLDRFKKYEEEKRDEVLIQAKIRGDRNTSANTPDNAAATTESKIITATSDIKRGGIPVASTPNVRHDDTEILIQWNCSQVGLGLGQGYGYGYG